MPGWKWPNPPNVQFRLNRDSHQARGLVAWWPTQALKSTGVLRDLVGRIDATGGTPVIFRNSKGQGLDYAANSSYSLPIVPALMPIDNFSIAAWVYRQGTMTNLGAILRSPMVLNDSGYMLVSLNTNVARFYVHNGASWVSIDATTLFTLSDWTHVVATYNNGAMQLYVNGVQQSDVDTSTISYGAVNANGRIGSYISGTFDFADVIGDLRLYNTTLSPGETQDQSTHRWELYEPVIPKWTIGWVAAGGTTYNQSISGGVTPSATLINQAQKVLVGSVTPTSSLIKQLQKVLTGGVTPTGTLLNQTQKVLSGNIIPNGSLLNQAQKALVGSITPISALTNQTQKVLSGSITPSGILAKAALISLIGSLTPSGTLTNQVQKILSGAISPLGQLLNQAQKVLSGNVTPGGVLTGVKTALVNLVGSLTPSGTLSKETQKLLSGSLTPVGSILKQASKILTGVLTPIGVLAASLVSTNLESTFKGMFRGMFRRMK